jgi:hypothetical protein
MARLSRRFGVRGRARRKGEGDKRGAVEEGVKWRGKGEGEKERKERGTSRRKACMGKSFGTSVSLGEQIGR